MAEATSLQDYENVPDQVRTLAEINEKITDYPAVVRVEAKEYEISDANELPGDKEILLEKPKALQFVLVRVLDFHDEEQVKTVKGEEFLKERKRFVGQEFLIPIGYQGVFKLINKPGRHSRYISVEQIIRDLPRFIRIDQETVYTPPGQTHATSTLAAGTQLEITRVSTVDKVRYIKCKSKKTSRQYIFRENFPINCTAADDPADHNFLNLAGKFILLPKDAQFQSVWADDVILKDDDEASTMLTITGGPIKILKSFIRQNMYVAWTMPEGSRQTVGLIPSRIWNSQLVQLKVFSDKSTKQEYIKQHFGEVLDSNFVVNGLYMMKQTETGVIWLLAPNKKMTAENLVDYENIERLLADNKMVNGEDEDDDSEDYEEPVSQSKPPLPCRLAPKVEEPSPVSTPVPDIEPILLPTPKVRKEYILHKIREKAKLGFDKVHEQLLRRTRHNSTGFNENSAKEKKQKHSETGNSSKNRSSATRDRDDFESWSLPEGSKEDESVKGSRTLRLSRSFESNRNRPLPGLPLETEINVTDDDKLGLYEDVEDDDVCPNDEDNNSVKNTPNAKLDTLARYPDLTKIGQANQTSEQFYSYSVEELVECLKMCKLDKLAIDCSENKLDGAFFRKFDLSDLKSEPFCLSSLDVFKVKKIIEEGWRPKSDHNSSK